MVAWRWLLLVAVLVAGCDVTAAPVPARIRHAYVESSGGVYGNTMIVEGEAPPDAHCQVLTYLEERGQPSAGQSPLYEASAVANPDGWVRVEQSIVTARQAASPYVLVRLRCQPGGESALVGVRVR